MSITSTDRPRSGADRRNPAQPVFRELADGVADAPAERRKRADIHPCLRALPDYPVR